MTSKKKTILGAGVLCLSLGLMAGCATKPASELSRSEVEFPNPVKAWMTNGSYPNLENLAKIRPGLTKDQIYGLVGRPHFSEGLAFVHEWNYIFQLPDGQGGYQACQYQIRYDNDMRVARTFWRDQTCATLLANALKPSAPAAPAPAPAPRTEHRAIDSRTLFAFASAQLSASGQQKIASVAQQVRSGFESPTVYVTGHTDRIGSAENNMQLSLRRAAAVRDALIQAGLSASQVKSSGAGETQPVKTCSDQLSGERLKSCLAPNRRVTIDVRESGNTTRKATAA